MIISVGCSKMSEKLNYIRFFGKETQAFMSLMDILFNTGKR